jgi:S-adenosylmethionine hydrolase
MAAIAPATRVVDLTHSLAPFDVEGAAAVLADVLPFAAPSVAVLVVDPGVGSPRRGIAVRCGRSDILVGPDNGLLTSVAMSVGAALAARELNDSRYHGHVTSSTFHARDVFCPVAAHLSLGVAFEDLGRELDLRELVAPLRPRVELSSGRITCEVINIDRFGNIRLPIKADALAKACIDGKDVFSLSWSGGEAHAMRARTYSDLGGDEVGLIEDSFGWLCLVVNSNSAATRLGLNRGSVISLK